MCYEGKCLYCIPVKAACLVLAVINAVLNGLVVMWYVFIWGYALLLFGPSNRIGGDWFDRDISERDWTGLMVIWYCFVAPLVVLLNVIFSSVLCNGICSGLPKQVKVYFWYGVAVTVVTAIAAVVLICVDSYNPYSMFSETSGTTGVIWLLGCVLHTLFLVLVHQTHKKVVEDTISNAPARLGENPEVRDKNYLIKV